MAGTIAPVRVEHRERGVVRTDVTILTDGSGVATAAVVGVGFGRLVGVLYDGGLDASAVITLSDAKTGAPIVAYTTGTEGTPVAFRPTGNIVDNAGATIAAHANHPNVNRDILIAGKVKVGVASGGATETGIVSFIVDEQGVGSLGVGI